MKTSALAPASAGAKETTSRLRVVLSFDVEEHDRIEAAAGLPVSAQLRAHCRERVDAATRWLLDELAGRGQAATFFVVGQVAEHNPRLVRDIHDAGHEVASHGWDHRRIHHFTPPAFREDVRTSKDCLEQVTGAPVVGYRAPTFSIGRPTAWALDVLVETGIRYDSSIYPVRHDRYGVPEAPRGPFWVGGGGRELLELPPATLRLLRLVLPMGGGGTFRLFPLFFLKWALRQAGRALRPAVAVLYFHPWEFDPGQRRLPLGWVNRLRTYVGTRRTRGRLAALLDGRRFARAIDVVEELYAEADSLPSFLLNSYPMGGPPYRNIPAAEPSGVPR
jgi:polysaccharide deacetylase family protein (PEP-CTERM system associated)